MTLREKTDALHISIEVDAEQEEMSIWQGNACLAVISINYCPNCGAKMQEVE